MFSTSGRKKKGDFPFKGKFFSRASAPGPGNLDTATGQSKKGINMNLLVHRLPKNVYRTDASKQGMGGCS